MTIIDPGSVPAPPNGVPMTFFPWRLKPYNNIQPFTVRDGESFLDTLEDMRDWISTQLVTYVDTTIGEYVIAFNKALGEVSTAFEEVRTFVDDANTTIDAKVAAFNTTVANANQAWNNLINRDNTNWNALVAADLSRLTTARQQVQAIVDNANQISTEVKAVRDEAVNVNRDIQAAAAILGRGRPANATVLFGDSITYYNQGPSTSTPKQSTKTSVWDGKGMHNWANAYLMHDLTILGNAGIPSQTTTQMLARFKSDVLDRKPDIVTILGGNNDRIGIPTIANLQSMYDQARAADILVVATSIPPGTNTNTGDEGKRQAVNAWMQDYASRNAGIVFADIAATWVDPSQNRFRAQPRFVSPDDGVHPTVAGAQVAGYAIALAMRRFVSENRTKAMPFNAPYNCISSPYFRDGITAGADSAHWLCGPWAIEGNNLTVKKETRTDGVVGDKLVITVPAGGAFEIMTNISQSANDIRVGDDLTFGMQMEYTHVDDDIHQHIATLQNFVTSTTFDDKAFDLYSSTAATDGGGTKMATTRMAFETAPYAAVASPIGTMQARITIRGGGTYKFMGAFVRNNSGITRAQAAI